MRSPVLDLSETSISLAMRGAVLLIQQRYRELRRRKEIASKQAFWKPRGSKNIKSSIAAIQRERESSCYF